MPIDAPERLVMKNCKDLPARDDACQSVDRGSFRGEFAWGQGGSRAERPPTDVQIPLRRCDAANASAGVANNTVILVGELP
jgi:hypothetical protein